VKVNSAEMQPEDNWAKNTGSKKALASKQKGARDDPRPSHSGYLPQPEQDAQQSADPQQDATAAFAAAANPSDNTSANTATLIAFMILSPFDWVRVFCEQANLSLAVDIS
jgi:hypothetical protein